LATFKQQVSAKTGLTFNSTSTPTEDQLSQFLVDGLSDVVNRTIKINPAESMKFAKTTNATGSVTRTGEILSVMREHDSTTVIRPCTQISPDLRYSASNVDSLYYRSKFNPAWYQLDNLIHCVPAASSSNNNDIIVTQIYYDTGVTHGDSAIDNFPTEYLYLVVLYASMESCLSRISHIESNFPEEPILATDVSEIDTQINNDDPEMAGVVKDKINQQITEHNARISEYQAEMQKSQVEIKTLNDKYLAFSNQYNTAFGLASQVMESRAEEAQE